MDWGQLIGGVISSGAIITATYYIVDGLKRRLASVEVIVKEQRGYIDEIRQDFKQLSAIKSNFIDEFTQLHLKYKEYTQQTYGEIIRVKQEQIDFMMGVSSSNTFTQEPSRVKSVQKIPGLSNPYKPH